MEGFGTSEGFFPSTYTLAVTPGMGPILSQYQIGVRILKKKKGGGAEFRDDEKWGRKEIER